MSLGRGIQAQEHLRTKVLQSFTQAPPELLNRFPYLYLSPISKLDLKVHEWRSLNRQFGLPFLTVRSRMKLGELTACNVD